MSDLFEILKDLQQKDGSFLSTTYRGGLPIQKTKTTFCTSLILQALKDTDLEGMKKKAVNFLLKNEKQNGSYNYWTIEKNIPSDLDDTALALIALGNNGLVDETRLMKGVDLLIANETEPGGPYYTWLVPKKIREDWNDIDMGVNSNIMHFLYSQGLDSPPLISYIEKRIESNDYTSKYYSPLVLMYFISKWYRGLKKETLLKKISKFLIGPYKNELEASLAVTSYLYLGGRSDACRSAILYIRRKRPTEIQFSVEEIRGGIPQYFSSTALTASLMLEALTLHEKVSLKEKNDRIELDLIEKIRISALRRFNGLSEDMQYLIAQSIEKVLKKDTHREITLTSYFCVKGKKYKEDDIVALGKANLLGWIGYTIYDDILDGEEKSLLIPLANICIREVSSIFESFTNRDFEYYRSILDRIEETNLWEHTNCKIKIIGNKVYLPHKLPSYGNYEKLGYKSLGHAIGPLIISRNSEQSNTLNFFLHYLIAKQMNDDAHDWLIDIKQGFLNSASVLMFNKFKRSIIDLKKDEVELRSIFWNRTIDQISKEIFSQVSLARKYLAKLDIDKKYFTNRLDSLWQSADEAIKERDKAKRHLRTTKKKA